MVLLFLQNHAGCTVTKLRRKTLRFVAHESFLPLGSFCLHKTRGNSVAGASSRTLARLFEVETGMSFSHYRRQVQMQAAVGMLASGLPVGEVAHILVTPRHLRLRLHSARPSAVRPVDFAIRLNDLIISLFKKDCILRRGHLAARR